MSPKTSQTNAPIKDDRRPVWIIGLLLLLCYGYYFYAGGNWNIESRMALTRAIVDRQTIQIDHYFFSKDRTKDAAFFSGHYYADKAVGASFLGVPVYWFFKQILGGVLPDNVWWIVSTYLVSLFVTALPSAIAGALFFLLLGYITPAVAPRVWLTLAYGLGTIAFPYATMFFGHQTAAALGFIAFYLLFRLRRQGWSPGWALLAGGLASYSVITDFLSALVVLGLMVYAIVTVIQQKKGFGARLTALLPFAVGLILALPLQLWYNWAAFGNPLSSAYKYEILEEFRIGMSAGFMGITYPKLEALYQLTFGPYRGLFYGSPFLLFIIPGAWIWLRRTRAKGEKAIAANPLAGYRLEGWLCVAIGGLALLINSSYYLWGGGGIYGARFMIPALPFICFLALPAIYFAPGAFKLLATVSMLFTFIVVATTPLIPENEPNPLFGAAFRDLFRRGLMTEPNFNFNLLMFLGVDSLISLLFLLLLGSLLLLRLRALRLAS